MTTFTGSSSCLWWCHLGFKMIAAPETAGPSVTLSITDPIINVKFKMFENPERRPRCSWCFSDTGRMCARERERINCVTQGIRRVYGNRYVLIPSMVTWLRRISHLLEFIRSNSRRERLRGRLHLGFRLWYRSSRPTGTRQVLSPARPLAAPPPPPPLSQEASIWARLRHLWETRFSHQDPKPCVGALICSGLPGAVLPVLGKIGDVIHKKEVCLGMCFSILRTIY